MAYTPEGKILLFTSRPIMAGAICLTADNEDLREIQRIPSDEEIKQSLIHRFQYNSSMYQLNNSS